MTFAISFSSFRSPAMHSLSRSILLAGALAAFAGCTTLSPDQQQQTVCPHEKELKEVHRQLTALAEDFGVDREQASGETTLELISEIRMASRNYKTYRDRILSAEEKDILSSYLNDQPEILNTILEQDRFIRSIRQKRIILLPDRD